MSVGETPSDLMSETRAFAALALAAIASRASFPVVATPSVTRAKSGMAPTLPSPLTSTQRSLVTSTRRVSNATAGEIAIAWMIASRNNLGERRMSLSRCFPGLGEASRPAPAQNTEYAKSCYFCGPV